MDKQKLLEFYNARKGPLNGVLVGFISAVCVINVGILQTLFIAICMGVGYFVGKKISEDKDYIINLLDRILPPGTFR